MNISNITPTLLEQEPETYLQHLEYCIHNNIDVTSIINSKVYSTWYSNHLTCLAYLVGDLVNTESFNNSNIIFYGKYSSIDDNLGVEILKKLLILGIDINSKNYYGHTVFDSLQHSYSISARSNNSLFKKYLNNLRRCPSP